MEIPTAGDLKDRVPLKPWLERIEAAVPRSMAEGEIPGMSIAVIRDSELVWYRAYGVRSNESEAPVTDDTLFQAASLSKPVFAYAVLKLVQEGALSLDRPLAAYLPYPDVANDPRPDAITARMVLSHNCGFPNWRGKNELKIFFEPGAIELYKKSLELDPDNDNGKEKLRELGAEE